jgi:hypothetical protein
MKAADITDDAFLDAIRTVHCDRWGSNPQWIGASIWDIAAVLDGHPEWIGGPGATDGSVQVPEKVVRAKAKKLIKRGLIDGCASDNCRGDFEIMPDGVRAERYANGTLSAGTPHEQRPLVAVSNTETQWASTVQRSPFA